MTHLIQHFAEAFGKAQLVGIRARVTRDRAPAFQNGEKASPLVLRSTRSSRGGSSSLMVTVTMTVALPLDCDPRILKVRIFP